MQITVPSSCCSGARGSYAQTKYKPRWRAGAMALLQKEKLPASTALALGANSSPFFLLQRVAPQLAAAKPVGFTLQSGLTRCQQENVASLAKTYVAFYQPMPAADASALDFYMSLGFPRFGKQNQCGFVAHFVARSSPH